LKDFLTLRSTTGYSLLVRADTVLRFGELADQKGSYVVLSGGASTTTTYVADTVSEIHEQMRQMRVFTK
jgi:hypothetical protein